MNEVQTKSQIESIQVAIRDLAKWSSLLRREQKRTEMILRDHQKQLDKIVDILEHYELSMKLITSLLTEDVKSSQRIQK